MSFENNVYSYCFLFSYLFSNIEHIHEILPVGLYVSLNHEKTAGLI